MDMSAERGILTDATAVAPGPFPLAPTTAMTIRKGEQQILTLADWLKLAGPKDPQVQWKEGRSAMESARAWLATPGAIPPEIAVLLATHPDFGPLTIEWIEPEARIPFDRHAGPRHADIAVRAHDARGTVALTVEAKADEPFDELLSEVLAASLERRITNMASGGVARAVDLARALLRSRKDGQVRASELRYQLFTGAAGTLALAHREGASRAVFLVHEIISDATSRAKLEANAADYVAFVRRLAGDAATEVRAGQLYGPIRVPGVPLWDNPAALYIGRAVRHLSDPKD